MGETALDRLRKQKENNNYSIEEQIESSSENQMDADSLVLTQMSSEAITTLKKKRKLEKVELEPEKPIIEEDKKVEVPKPIMTKSEDKKLERDKMEQFIHSLALDLLATCKKLSINFHEFNSEQLNILWDYILSKVEKE